MPDNGSRRVLVLASSPRRNGNSRRLAETAAEGAREAGHAVEVVHLPDVVTSMLRDCRECRGADGECAIDDGYDDLIINKVLPADGLIYATPLWWYGMSAHLKNFIDRTFCYISESYPRAEEVNRRLPNKHAGLLMSAEESNFGARVAVLSEMHELCRYLHHTFVGFVVGIGNRRGDVEQDPLRPLEAARDLGRHLFDIRSTDYKLDTDRPASVWEAGSDWLPAHWR